AAIRELPVTADDARFKSRADPDDHRRRRRDPRTRPRDGRDGLHPVTEDRETIEPTVDGVALDDTAGLDGALAAESSEAAELTAELATDEAGSDANGVAEIGVPDAEPEAEPEPEAEHEPDAEHEQ